jgi:hypothetical protein
MAIDSGFLVSKGPFVTVCGFAKWRNYDSSYTCNLKKNMKDLKVRAFCDVAPRSQVEVDEVSEVRTDSIIRALWRYMPEDSKLHTRRRENLKCHYKVSDQIKSGCYNVLLPSGQQQFSR